MENFNIRKTYKTRYGLDWPHNSDGTPINDIFIDLTLAKKARLEPFCHGNLLSPGEHMLRATTALFTSEDFGRNRWMESMVHAFCDYDSCALIGCASSGKSNCMGFMTLLYWVTDPLDTYCAVATTSLVFLRLRVFEAITRAHRLLKKNPHFEVPGIEAPSQVAIINDNAQVLGASAKAAIRGIAMREGDEAANIARAAGSHLKYTLLSLDESNHLPPAAAKARFNAAAGAQRFVFVTMANPTSFTDECMRLCEPETGWSTVDETSFEWVSRYGLRVVHFNGFDSPAVVEPNGEQKYPYLISQPQIDRMLKDVDGNDQDPIIWSMVRGMCPPTGMQNTVLSPADVHSFGADQAVVWGENAQITRFCGLDPSFSSGGDAAIAYPIEAGRMSNGLVGINLLEPRRLAIDASSSRPVSYQVVDRAVEVCKTHGIPLGNIAIDDSGTQSVADIWQTETGVAPIRCNFAARAPGIIPPDTQKSVKGASMPRPKYSNMVTELWSLMAKLVRQGRIRGLRGKAQAQFCGRVYKKDQKPLALEAKLDFKQRNGGKSPDEADAAAVALLAAFRKGAISLDENQTSTSWLTQPVILTKKIKTYVDTHMMKGYSEPRY